MGSLMLVSLFNLVDVFWVGKLGADALAGVSASTFLIWSCYSIMDISASGINTLVAHNVGAQDLDRANHSGSIGLIIGFFLGSLVAVSGLTYQHDFFNFMRLSEAVQYHASAYLTWFMSGIIITFTWRNIDSIYRGSGDTKTPLQLFSVALVLNIIFDPILIFGIGPFPELGVSGTALATILSQLLSCIIGWIILHKRGWRFATRSLLEDKASTRRITKRIMAIGLPIGATGFMFSMVYVVMTPIIATFGTAAVAAVGVGHRLESLAYFSCVGFSMAAATLVGQNLGAGKTEAAERAAWLTAFYLTIVLIPVSLAFIFIPHWIVPIFITDPEVVAEGTRYLRIIGFCEIFMGLEIVMQQAFSGAGDSLPAMWINGSLTLARVPLAYLLAIPFGLGSSGIWLTISITTFCKGILISYWFRLGHWKKKHLAAVETPVTLMSLPLDEYS